MIDDPSSVKTLYLIRHGVADSVSGRCIGHTDAPLSAEGLAQCARLALAWNPPSDAVVWSSDLSRAHDSACALLDAWALPRTRLRSTASLRECSFGAWDGRTWAELEATDGARLDHWMRDWQSVAPPDGESLPEFADRVRTALHRIAATDPVSHVIVAHAGTLRAILCTILDAPDSAGFSWAMPHAHVSRVTMVVPVSTGDAIRGTVEWLHAFPAPSTTLHSIAET